MLIPFKKLKDKYGINPTGVLHIGASTGQEANDYYLNGVLKTVWIEAIPSVYAELCGKLEQFAHAIPINACITDKDGETIAFNISNNEAQSSSIFEFGTHSTAHPEVVFVDKIELTTTRVDTLFTEHQLSISDYEFLNIDLQGAELLALKSMGSLIDEVQYVYVEVNKAELYKGCPLVEDIAEFLITRGFELKELQWCGNFGWGDAFFMRENKV